VVSIPSVARRSQSGQPVGAIRWSVGRNPAYCLLRAPSGEVGEPRGCARKVGAHLCFVECSRGEKRARWCRPAEREGRLRQGGLFACEGARHVWMRSLCGGVEGEREGRPSAPLKRRGCEEEGRRCVRACLRLRRRRRRRFCPLSLSLSPTHEHTLQRPVPHQHAKSYHRDRLSIQKGPPRRGRARTERAREEKAAASRESRHRHASCHSHGLVLVRRVRRFDQEGE
jgi:hypothetical protein